MINTTESVVEVGTYPANGAMLVMVHTVFDGEPDSFPISVNVDGAENLPDGLFLAKNYSEMEDIFSQLVEDGIIEKVLDDAGAAITFPSGYVDLPLCKLGPNAVRI